LKRNQISPIREFQKLVNRLILSFTSSMRQVIENKLVGDNWKTL